MLCRVFAIVVFSSSCSLCFLDNLWTSIWPIVDFATACSLSIALRCMLIESDNSHVFAFVSIIEIVQAYFGNIKMTCSVLVFAFAWEFRYGLTFHSDPVYFRVSVWSTPNLSEYHIYLVSCPVLTECQWICWDFSFCMEMSLVWSSTVRWLAVSSFGCFTRREGAGIRKKLFSFHTGMYDTILY